MNKFLQSFLVGFVNFLCYVRFEKRIADNSFEFGTFNVFKICF